VHQSIPTGQRPIQVTSRSEMTSAFVLPDTRYSLLLRLVDAADVDAWNEFAAIYDAAVFRYARRRGLQDADAREVVQQVLVAVHQAAAGWEQAARQRSFRAWLFETAHRQCLHAFRMQKRFDRARGGSTDFQQIHATAAPAELMDDNGVNASVDQRDWALSWAVSKVEHEVEPSTWKAFWLTAVESIPAETVAELLKITIGNVYVAKCRVLARIRDRARAILQTEIDSAEKTSGESISQMESRHRD